MAPRKRPNRPLIALIVALSVVVAAPIAASAGTTTAAAPTLTALPAGGPGVWVTLITGDRVLVRGTDGKSDLLVEPAPRAVPAGIVQFTRRGDRYVVPTDAFALVQDGIVDERLFNVTGLVRQGYDDAHTDRVPLLVKSAAAKMAAPSGTSLRRALPNVGMTALDEKKPEAPQFWSRLLASSQNGPKAKDGKLQLTGDVQRIWLNAKVRATLDQSVPQIGAPVAWSHGYTGAGVTVAVLDTGIDATHPDFGARIGATKDFSGVGTVVDGFGHGTHVASIVAGSGAASDGKYKGVAPDTTLAIGKVLDDSGFGSTDAVIAGMQWAASEVHAKVVNLSLGTEPTDGTDPAAVAVNDLTRDYGTLFVIAAGNFGGDNTVSSPASADAALAVASVTKSDVLSDFSSRGPRLTDGALKPDLAAPGGDIVAALSSASSPLGEPVGDRYQSLSGTSMASPHVAGSAALLAQQHPDWKAGQLKDALMSSVVQVANTGPFAVGTGRLDVGRATTQQIYATGSVSAFLPWPNQGVTKTQTVTWHNSGTASVTLALSSAIAARDGTPAPAGLVSLSASSVTVPAGGEATVNVTVTAQNGKPGQYAGILSGRSADGAVSTRTGLAVFQEEQTFAVTINLLDRDGNVPVDPNGYITIFDLDHMANAQTLYSSGTIRLPAGRYAFHGMVQTPRSGLDSTMTLISQPELRIDRDVVQTLDARLGKPVSSAPDDPAARGGAQSMTVLTPVADCGCNFGTSVTWDPRFMPMYAATVPGASSPNYTFIQTRLATEPDLELFARTGQPFEVQSGWLSEAVTDQITLPVVHAGRATPAELARIDVRGKLVAFDVELYSPRDEAWQRVADIKAAGGKMAMILTVAPATFTAKGGNGGSAPIVPALPTMYSSGGSGDRFVAAAKAGGLTASVVGRQFQERRYELAYLTANKVDTDQVQRPKTRDLVAIRSGYYNNASGASHGVAASSHLGGQGLSASFMRVLSGREATEYFTPGTWTLLEQTATTDSQSQDVTLRRGQPFHVTWNKAVAGPSLKGTYKTPTGFFAGRADNTMDLTLPMFSDSSGRTRLSTNFFGEDTGSISLYRNGTLVSAEASPTWASFPVPGDAASYRLVAEANRTATWWPLSTKVSATWTFRSGAADNGKALPLLTARFDPAVDLRNRAPGSVPFTIPAYVARQGSDTPAIKTFTVDVSYDDGKTWRPAAVSPAGDHFSVRVTHPAIGYASLRAKATDKAGNTVEQTVIRAYAIGA